MTTVDDLSGAISLYRVRMMRTALRITRNNEDAEDAVQNASVKALRYIDQFQGGDCQLSTWLFVIVTREAFQLLRGDKRRDCCFSIDQDDLRANTLKCHAPGPEEQLKATEFSRDLDLALSELNGNLRDTFELRYMEGLAFDDIAAARGMNVSTVKSRVFRTRDFVQRKLKRHC